MVKRTEKKCGNSNKNFSVSKCYCFSKAVCSDIMWKSALHQAAGWPNTRNVRVATATYSARVTAIGRRAFSEYVIERCMRRHNVTGRASAPRVIDAPEHTSASFPWNTLELDTTRRRRRAAPSRPPRLAPTVPRKKITHYTTTHKSHP